MHSPPPLARGCYAAARARLWPPALGLLEGWQSIRRYELTNHLGNVLAVVSDRKHPVAQAGNAALVDFYLPEMLAAQYYYPFGLEMPGRKWAVSGGYRFGFNGKERDKDGEWGSFGRYDYGYRGYDPVACRFMGVDPLAGKYPMLSAYQFASNTPIWAIDLDGLEAWKVNTLSGGSTEFNGPFGGQKEAQIAYDNTIDPASIKPKDQYESAILNGKISFNQNYGWVDETHAFTNTSRTDFQVGIDKLWGRVQSEENVSFRRSDEFFSTSYKQDVLIMGFSFGITESYDIKSGLSLEEKRRVTLAIVQDVTKKFETLQGIHPTSGSSFEPADLPSNMLSYYRTVFGWSEDYVKYLTKPLGPISSLMVYRDYPGTFTEKKYKNYFFLPKYFYSIYTPNAYKIPKELQSVVPFYIAPAPRSMSTRFSNINFKVRHID